MPALTNHPESVFALPVGCSFAGASSDEAINAVWERDQAAYGDENISLDALRAWFSAYPAGGLYLWKEGRIVAGIGIWPLTESSYEGLLAGDLDENSIGSQHIPRTTDGQLVECWNLAGFFVEPEFRQSSVLPLLLTEGFSRLAASGIVAPECRMLGLGLSEHGIRTMLRLGFSPLGNAAVGLPRYERTFTFPADLTKLAAQIEKSYAHRTIDQLRA